MTISIHNSLQTFAVLTPTLQVKPVAVTPSLYADLDSDFSGFSGHTLLSVHEFSEPWSSWERHPAGDEIVMLLSGQVTLILRTDHGEETVALDQAGTYVIIPRNIWHTARTATATRMLFFTPGEGTEHQA